MLLQLHGKRLGNADVVLSKLALTEWAAQIAVRLTGTQ